MGAIEIQKLMRDEQRYSMIFYRIIDACRDRKTYEEIEALVGRGTLNSPIELLDWLNEAGAIEPFFEDEAEYWAATADGLEFIANESPEARLSKVIAKESEYEELIMAILRHCENPRTLVSLEEKFNPLLAGKNITVSYFLSVLENAGAVRWDNGWRADVPPSVII